MFKKSIVSLALIASMLSPSIAVAQEPMRKGDIAKTDGVFLTPEISAKLTGRLELLKESVKLEVSKQEKLDNALCTKKLEDSKALGSQREKQLQLRLLSVAKEKELISKQSGSTSVSKLTATIVTVGSVIASIVGTVFVMKALD